MKVYVITKGVYSDYHIVGVVLDKNRAEEIVETISTTHSKAFVEEYDTDSFATCLRFEVYYIYGNWNAIVDEYNNKHMNNCLYDENHFIVYAKDKDHAIKIAQDMRAEYLAKKKGIT